MNEIWFCFTETILTVASLRLFLILLLVSWFPIAKLFEIAKDKLMPASGKKPAFVAFVVGVGIWVCPLFVLLGVRVGTCVFGPDGSPAVLVLWAVGTTIWLILWIRWLQSGVVRS